MPVIYISPYLANMQNEPNAKIYTTNLLTVNAYKQQRYLNILMTGLV